MEKRVEKLERKEVCLGLSKNELVYGVRHLQVPLSIILCVCVRLLRFFFLQFLGSCMCGCALVLVAAVVNGIVIYGRGLRTCQSLATVNLKTR